LHDDKITANEVDRIKQHIAQDGKLDWDDVNFLVELLADANEVCSEFDDLFFPVLREVLLADGQVGLDEQFQLLRLLYADGNVRDSEKQFLKELHRDAENVTPEFTQLCETALECPASDWDLGGKPRS
jgi:hypothetical protein